MTDTLFISDLHLSEATPQVEAGLADFLKKESAAEAIYLLGDIFEAWIGDDDDADLPRRIAKLLKATANNGTAVYLMRGNRDFLLGNAYAEECGATLILEPTVINLHGVETLLIHGDVLCTADTEYQKFRSMAHSPAWQSDILSKSLAERREIAKMIRMASKDAGSNKAEDILDVTAEAVENTGKQHGVARMIHGHTHRPHCHEHEFGTRWVLGDWDSAGWCLRANEHGIRLESFQL